MASNFVGKNWGERDGEICRHRNVIDEVEREKWVERDCRDTREEREKYERAPVTMLPIRPRMNFSWVVQPASSR